jgi:CheY-like chemotaxis protein
VLVVDDDPDCRIIYSKLLQRHGYMTPAEVRKQLTRKAA